MMPPIPPALPSMEQIQQQANEIARNVGFQVLRAFDGLKPLVAQMESLNEAVKAHNAAGEANSPQKLREEIETLRAKVATLEGVTP